jgi:hypothetical protein
MVRNQVSLSQKRTDKIIIFLYINQVCFKGIVGPCKSMILDYLNFKNPLEFDTSTKFSYNKREKDEKKLQTHHLKFLVNIFFFKETVLGMLCNETRRLHDSLHPVLFTVGNFM